MAKIFPNPPRHSRRSVSDGVIQLRVPLAGCAGFFLQAPIPRRILTKMSGAICCMNMRLQSGRGSTRASKSASRHSVVRVVRLGNSKLCEFPQRGAAERVLSLYTTTPVLSWKTAKIWRVATWNVNKIYIRMILLSAEAWCLEICFPPQCGACSRSLHREAH